MSATPDPARLRRLLDDGATPAAAGRAPEPGATAEPSPSAGPGATAERSGSAGRSGSGASGRRSASAGASEPAALSAAEVVERLRLWEATPSGRPATRERGGRPWLALNMVCTADGRATIGGRSGPIGKRADRELFHALRTAVDAVLVGAGTARAERYRRLVRDPQAQALRRARGLAEEPLACIVSASLALSAEDVPLLGDEAARVAILTSSPASLPEGAAAEVRYVRCAREGLLDLRAALVELRRELGVRTVLCEGGPHLAGQLLAEGLLDELFLSLAPKLAGGDAASESPRIVAGPELRPPVELELAGALESESNLLLRYRVRDAAVVAGGAAGDDDDEAGAR